MPPKTMPTDLLALHRRASTLGTAREDLGPVAPALGAAQLTVAPWAIYPPPDALDFSRAVSFTPGAGPVTVTPAGLQVQLDRGYVAVVRDITLIINDMLATTDVVFRLRVNQGPVQGWEALTILPRVAGSVSRGNLPESTVIRIPDGALIDWQIVVNDAGVYRIGVDYHGWSVSKKTADRYGSW